MSRSPFVLIIVVVVLVAGGIIVWQANREPEQPSGQPPPPKEDTLMALPRTGVVAGEYVVEFTDGEIVNLQTPGEGSRFKEPTEGWKRYDSLKLNDDALTFKDDGVYLNDKRIAERKASFTLRGRPGKSAEISLNNQPPTR